MKTVKGNGVSIGTAIGTAFIYENEVDLSLDSKHSFLDAVKTLTEKYTLQIEEFKNDGRVDEADVLDAYILVMQDPEITNAIDQEKEKSVKDVFEVFNSNAEVLKSMEDEYFRQRAEDIISVGPHLQVHSKRKDLILVQENLIGIRRKN